mmetsp:Transcript_69057/g.202171  ORF Transcript_69057/g.202171 Transcript_69057/m.202171 type:complete len:557 (-) Transcript_69057:68-1738(-)
MAGRSGYRALARSHECHTCRLSRRFPLLLCIVAAASPEAAEGTSTVVALNGDLCHAQGGLEYCQADGTCHPDGNCERCEGHMTEDTDAHECIDRTPFGSHVAVDACAAVIWFLGAGLAMSAGVGGGGIFVPLGIILLRFASKPSTGLSQASIFGASLAGLIINARSRHPKADRPLIDLDMALFLAPMQMAGALVGVIVQKILPTWAVIVAMAVILGYTAFKTTCKGISTFKKERLAREERLGLKVVPFATNGNEQGSGEKLDEPKVASVEVPDGKVVPGEVAEKPTSPSFSADSITVPGLSAPPVAWEEQGPMEPAERQLPSVDDWLKQEAAPPWASAGYLLVMWAMLIALLVAKGGKGSPGLFEYCSEGYWICTALSFVWLFGFSLLMGRRVVSKTVNKSAVGFPFVEGDVIWNFALFRYYCVITFFAGIVAGLIGIGGGMVLGPVMLQLGILPQVSAATNATMILLSSSPTALAFVTGGLVPWTYAIIFFAVAFVGSYAGKSYIDALVKKYQMTSIIVLILAFIIAFASAMMTVNGLIIYKERDWHFEGLYDVC